MKCPTCGKEQGIYIQKPMVAETWREYPVRNEQPMLGWYSGILYHEDGSVEFVK